MLSLLASDCIYLLDTFEYNPEEFPGTKKKKTRRKLNLTSMLLKAHLTIFLKS